MNKDIEDLKNLSLRVKFAKFAINLNGRSFIKLMNLIKKLNQQMALMQSIIEKANLYKKDLQQQNNGSLSSNLVNRQNTIQEETHEEDERQIVDKVYIKVGGVEIDFFCENLLDLVSEFSQSNITKIFATF